MSEKLPATMPELDDDKVDKWLMAAKAAASLFPGGGILAEMLDGTVQGQRMDRVVDVIRRIEARLGDVEEALKAFRQSEDAADITYQAMRYAADAKSPERRERIAALAASGISGQMSALETSRLLRLSASIDDEQIAWLIAATKGKPDRYRRLGRADTQEHQNFAVIELKTLGLLEERPPELSGSQRTLRPMLGVSDMILNKPEAKDLFVTPLATALLRAMDIDI